MSEQLELFPDLVAGPRELWEFARWVITEGPFQGMDLDGSDIQKKAEELGLIREASYDPELHGYGGFNLPGDPWYELCGPLAEKPT